MACAGDSLIFKLSCYTVNTMKDLFDRTFFKFLFGFLLIIFATLLVVAGIQVVKSDSTQMAAPTKATTTSQ